MAGRPVSMGRDVCEVPAVSRRTVSRLVTQFVTFVSLARRVMKIMRKIEFLRCEMPAGCCGCVRVPDGVRAVVYVGGL